MFHVDMLKRHGFDLIKANVPKQEVHAIEAEFRAAGAPMVSKVRQKDGLFTVFAIGLDDRIVPSTRNDVAPQRQTVDKAMTSGR